MLEQKKKVINGTTYAVTQLGAIAALKIQTKLLRIVGPGIAGLDVEELKGSGDLQQKFMSTIMKILPEMFATFDDAVVNSLIEDLFESNVFVMEGATPTVLDFDDHFVGKPLDIWKVARFILEVNFASGKSLGSNSHTTSEAEATPGNTT